MACGWGCDFCSMVYSDCFFDCYAGSEAHCFGWATKVVELIAELSGSLILKSYWFLPH